MDEYDSYKLSGSLLEWPVKEIGRSDLEHCSALQFHENVGESNWEKFEFTSSEPLRDKDQGESGPFSYVVICRRSGSRIAMLSLNRQIVDHLAHQLMLDVFSLRSRRVSIAVGDLVNELVERPTRYCLSFVYARVPAFGASLRNVSFFGDDLGEASLFRENAHLLNVVNCGIRRTEGGSEIVRLAGDGRISFNMSSSKKVIEVEEVLRFLRKENYLSTEIWPEG